MPPHPPDDRAAALALLGRDDRAARRLDIFHGLLGRWRAATDLISQNSFADVWIRHIADSGQLLDYAPAARTWVDLGSGAGFPGLVIAILLADTPGARVHCIESDRRKCAFLREVARETGAPAQIHAERIEAIDPGELMPVDAVTARAFAPLPRLLGLAKVWIEAGAVGVFPRGKTTAQQLAGLTTTGDFAFETSRSRVDADARIVCARRLARG